MESNNFLTKILLMGETNMDNIEEELNKLQPVKQDEEENSDASLFSGMKKKKKRDKLFSEVTSILEDSGDDDMLSAFHFKSKKKNNLDKTDDIFYNQSDLYPISEVHLNYLSVFVSQT